MKIWYKDWRDNYTKKESNIETAIEYKCSALSNDSVRELMNTQTMLAKSIAMIFNKSMTDAEKLKYILGDQFEIEVEKDD